MALSAKIRYCLNYFPTFAPDWLPLPEAKTGNEDYFLNFLMKTFFLDCPVVGGCGTCAINFVTDPMPNIFGAASVKSTIAGGISGFAFIDKNISFTNVADPAQWVTHIAAEKVRGFNNGCRIKAGLSKPSQETKTVGSCANEEVVKSTQPFSFQLFEFADDFVNLDIFDWLSQSDKWQCMTLAIFSCPDSKKNGRQLAWGFNPLTGKFPELKSFFAWPELPDTDADYGFIGVEGSTDFSFLSPIDITAVLSSATVNLNGQ